MAEAKRSRGVEKKILINIPLESKYRYLLNKLYY